MFNSAAHIEIRILACILLTTLASSIIILSVLAMLFYGGLEQLVRMPRKRHGFLAGLQHTAVTYIPFTASAILFSHTFTEYEPAALT